MKKHSQLLIGLFFASLWISSSAVMHPVMGQATDLAVERIVADLEGLPLDDFFEQSFTQLLLRNPEWVTEIGLAEVLGTGNDQLTNISPAYMQETQALESAILDLLKQYDRETMTPDQQLSYDIYVWYIDDRVRQHKYEFYDYPVNQFLFSENNALIHLFTELHPIRNQQDADDYITRLSQVDTKFEQLLEQLQIREDTGVIPPRFIVQWTRNDIIGLVRGGARNTPFYTSFAERVNDLDGLADGDKQALLEAAEAEIETRVIPAYQSLADYLEHLETIATDDDGVWKLPEGEEYYAYLLRHHTTTDLTADAIHELGLQEVARIQAEMRIIFDQLGYPEDASLTELFDQVAADSGYLRGADIVTGYETIIQQVSERLGGVFDKQPQTPVIVIGGEEGGYYQPASRDGSRPGAFYASAVGVEPIYRMSSLAYHEAIPGHHLQIALAQELDLPLFRNEMNFTGYVEGWALYAERLVAEMGRYANDPYGDLGRLQYEAFRAVRLVVDTGIHAKHWTFREAVAYMQENTGLPQGMVQWEISRYIVYPGQATAYQLGMLKILELRQQVQAQLGDEFDIKEFHNVILGSGSMSLDILEQIVREYIESKDQKSA